jgi:murein DD-endopeptidase MepM/ murein hydrolase activator NlpD
MPQFHAITVGKMATIRGWDAQGGGLPGAHRTHPGGHKGLDIVAKPGHHILSPIDGVVDAHEHFAWDTAVDRALGGLCISGTGAWKGYEVLLFHVQPIFHGQVRAGQAIGVARDITGYAKYKGALNHVHLGVKRDGHWLNPLHYFGWFSSVPESIG